MASFKLKGEYSFMNSCGTDLLCGLLSELLGNMTLIELNLFKVLIYITFAYGFYYSGSSSSSRSKFSSYKEGFINGIQYYVNIDAYNKANIPYNIDENAEYCVAVAKARLAKHIHPISPPKSN